MESRRPVLSALMCHAPIVIPGIGLARAKECAATTSAMRRAARAIVESGAGVVLLLSPHLPRHRRAYGFVPGAAFRGDFRSFGVEDIELAFKGDLEVIASLRRGIQGSGLEVMETPCGGLDHGSLVPLWFLNEAGYAGGVVVLGFPWNSSPAGNIAFGKMLAKSMASFQKPWAFLASGDMSHALLPGAPGGFHPRAKAFDKAVLDLLRDNRLSDLQSIPSELRELAAEDVLDSLFVLYGVLGGKRGTQWLSYEGPFGVGYGVAVFGGEL